MNYIDRHVGARLRRERIALGRSLHQKAVLIGADEVHLTLFEAGAARVGAADLFKCCEALGLKPSDLFDDLLSRFPPGFDNPAEHPDA